MKGGEEAGMAERLAKNGNEALRAHLVELLEGHSAHLDAQSVFAGVRPEHWGALLPGAPHTLWQLLEHTRFTLQDLLAFSTDPAYTAPKWPDSYWPEELAPLDAAAARRAVEVLQGETERMIALVEDPDTDLFAPIAWGEGQTILREALLAADHSSYHLGQAMFLRKQLEASAEAAGPQG